HRSRSFGIGIPTDHAVGPHRQALLLGGFHCCTLFRLNGGFECRPSAEGLYPLHCPDASKEELTFLGRGKKLGKGGGEPGLYFAFFLDGVLCLGADPSSLSSGADFGSRVR